MIVCLVLFGALFLWVVFGGEKISSPQHARVALTINAIGAAAFGVLDSIGVMLFQPAKGMLKISVESLFSSISNGELSQSATSPGFEGLVVWSAATGLLTALVVGVSLYFAIQSLFPSKLQKDSD